MIASRLLLAATSMQSYQLCVRSCGACLDGKLRAATDVLADGLCDMMCSLRCAVLQATKDKSGQSWDDAKSAAWNTYKVCRG